MTIEERVIHLCIQNNLKITCAESCTGGLLASRLVSVAGASDCFERSYVTYSDRAKMEELMVSEETLRKWSAVSRQTASEMAEGALTRADADIALSVTGYAGPDSGHGEEVGLVYIGCAFMDSTQCFLNVDGSFSAGSLKVSLSVKEFHFQGSRTQVREQAADMALQMAEEILAHGNHASLENFCADL
ncbi:MAG: CinA family protein [Lachnospiraceae bacterium]|nr:CinA family protein [Lachnospiraceae bacterium]